MRRLILALATTAVLAIPAMAQTNSPSPKVEFGVVPADAIASSNIVGLTAYNGNKDSVGEIKDLIIDQGELKGYVLSVGGFLGMGEHYVEVRPKSIAITYDQSAKKWKAFINANKDELKAAPEYKYNERMKN